MKSEHDATALEIGKAKLRLLGTHLAELEESTIEAAALVCEAERCEVVRSARAESESQAAKIIDL